MVKARTLAENITILAATMPAVADPQRWRGLLDALKSMGMAGRRPWQTCPWVLDVDDMADAGLGAGVDRERGQWLSVVGRKRRQGN